MLKDAGLRERDFVDHHAGLRTGVFILDGGTWVIETHEPRISGPPGLTGT